MGKHTPGPWFPVLNTADSWDINVADDRYAHTVASAYRPFLRNGVKIFDGDEEANANLIAAAPDLLDALETICIQYQILHAPPPPAWIRNGIAVVSKAKGECLD